MAAKGRHHISKAIHRELDSADYAFRADTDKPLENIHQFKKQQILDNNSSLQQDVSALEQYGYVILKDLLSPSQIAAIKSETHRLGESLSFGRNQFEGKRTKRIYGLLGKSRIYDQLILNERILNILDYYLLPNHLLTAFQAIEIGPNERQQILHYDDGFIHFPRPRKPTSIAFIWAIDAFTKENGATVVIPGSHRWGNDRVPTEHDTLVPAVMSEGSCLCLLSTTWHGGGANRTDGPRLAISNQHCEPYIRPQENQILSVPFGMVKELDPRLQSMCGYSIHYPFIGHSDGKHPLKAIQSRL